jgi:hypothetical protein
VAGSTHNYLCFLRLVRFLSSTTSPDPDPDQFCVSSPPLFSICVYLLCVPMLLVRLRLRFRARLRLVLLVRRRRVSSSSEIKSFNLSAIVWLVL